MFVSELATGRRGVSGAVRILSHAWACSVIPSSLGKLRQRYVFIGLIKSLNTLILVFFFLVSFLIFFFFFELTVVAPTDELLNFSLTSKHPLSWMDSYK